MIYRKKILLALTELFDGNVSATDFQKLLFLFSEKQIERKFDFIPYKYGCFSFQSMADKNSLIREGILENTKNWKLSIEHTSYLSTIKESDKKYLLRIKSKFGNFSTKELIRAVYTNYPYFAINSEVAEKYLNDSELNVIEKFRPKIEKTGLYTIGYEGLSLESYLNNLIQNDIKILCDVRKNPMSRKYGFAKKTLQNACESVNIKYVHMPELGIISSKRVNLNKQSDYDSLFQDYEKNVLPNQGQAIAFIQTLVKTYKRVALTCFEAHPHQCHRTRVAKAVHSVDEDIPINHLLCQKERS